MQSYSTNAGMEYAIRGNAVILKCQVPSFMADFVTVISWHTDEGEDFFPTEIYGNCADYLLHLIHRTVVPIPSKKIYYHFEIGLLFFFFTFHVQSWNDMKVRNIFYSQIINHGKTEIKLNLRPLLFLVVMQVYETTVGVDFAIRGNSVVLKCGIPSFVADFVQVMSWLVGDLVVYPSQDNG